MKTDEQEITFKSLFIPFTTLKAALILVFTGIAVFMNSLFNPFVYDDIQNIVISPYVRNLASIPSYFYSGLAYPGTSILQFFHIFYLPFLFTIYTILVSAFGISPLPFHPLQLTLHIISALLLFLIFSKFFKLNLAFLLSLIFLVHPLNSEAVIYIAALQYPLLMTFGLIVFYLLLKKQEILLSYRYQFFLAFLLFLCLLSKETGILFIPILLFYALLFSRKNLKRIVGAIFFATVPYLILKILAANHALWTIYPSAIHRAGLLTRIITIPKILLYYISKFFIPINFSVDQRWLVKQINFQSFYFPAIVDVLFFAGIFICGVYIYQRKTKLFGLYIFFALWFCLGISTVLQIIPLDVTVADRWFYFPFVGLLGMLGIIYNAFFERLKTKKLITNLILILSVILILLLSALTIVRNSQWQTSSQLYSHDEKYAGESAELEAYLGEIFVANGQLNTAKIRFEKAISFDPMGDSLNGLAYVYEQQKNYTKAKKLYWQNIKLSNGLPKYISYEGLTRIALIDEHNPWEAKQLSKAAFVLYPNDEALIKLLAFSEYFTKDKTEALETFRKLLNIVPNQENQKIYLMMENNKLTY